MPYSIFQIYLVIGFIFEGYVMKLVFLTTYLEEHNIKDLKKKRKMMDRGFIRKGEQ